MEEKFFSISEFEKFMKSSSEIRESFEKCIKDMRRQSIFEYTDLLNEAVESPKTTSKIFIIHNGKECIFTARLVCGTRCEINMVYTSPLYRGKGYCVNSLKKIVKKLKNKVVFLEVNKNNSAAIRCYEKVGFAKTKTIGTLSTMVYKNSNRKTRKNKARV